MYVGAALYILIIVFSNQSVGTQSQQYNISDIQNLLNVSFCAFSIDFNLLLPANEVNAFTPVCHSVHKEGSASVGRKASVSREGVCASRKSASSGYAFKGEVWSASALAGGLPIGYYGIRWTSRRYASYWNAFLFNKVTLVFVFGLFSSNNVESLARAPIIINKSHLCET